MAEVTAALVKELRDKTGAGMMDCKRALGETGGNIENGGGTENSRNGENRGHWR